MCSAHASKQGRRTRVGWEGGRVSPPPPGFDRSVNPTSTRGKIMLTPPWFSDIPMAHASAFQTYTTMGTKSYEIQIKSKLNFYPATISGEKDFSFFWTFDFCKSVRRSSDQILNLEFWMYNFFSQFYSANHQRVRL